MTEVKFVMEVGKKSPFQRFELMIEAETDSPYEEAKELCLDWLADTIKLRMQKETGKKIPVTISGVEFHGEENRGVEHD